MLLNKEQKNIIAEENYSLVFYVVNMFASSGIPFDELTSVATVGYAKALNAFDDERQVKFSTYAINCIRNEILYFLRKEKQYMTKTISMNTILSTDKNGNNLLIEDTVSFEKSENELDLEASFLLKEDLEAMITSLDSLSKKEKYIIIYRYGLFSQKIKTQKEIADKIGMSQANVSKLEKSILDKLKKLLVDNIKCI